MSRQSLVKRSAKLCQFIMGIASANEASVTASDDSWTLSRTRQPIQRQQRQRTIYGLNGRLFRNRTYEIKQSLISTERWLLIKLVDGEPVMAGWFDAIRILRKLHHIEMACRAEFY